MRTVAYPVSEPTEPRPLDGPPPQPPAGDRFDELFERFYAPLFGLAFRLLGDRLEAEDTVQETFLKLSLTLVQDQDQATPSPTLRGRADAEVGAWLRRVCLNLGANRLRERRRSLARLERVGRLAAADQAADAASAGPPQVFLRQEQQREVRAALLLLPERQRNCLLLRYAGHSYAEIADTLGVATGSVGVLLARAERAFREVYQPEGPASGATRAPEGYPQ
jgi:RNA polymerase sigma factor (sigma-70 family)